MSLLPQALSSHKLARAGRCELLPCGCLLSLSNESAPPLLYRALAARLGGASSAASAARGPLALSAQAATPRHGPQAHRLHHSRPPPLTGSPARFRLGHATRLSSHRDPVARAAGARRVPALAARRSASSPVAQSPAAPPLRLWLGGARRHVPLSRRTCLRR